MVEIKEVAAGFQVSGPGFDEIFQRMWLFYLCYSRAGFETGYLNVQQIVLDKVSTRASAKAAAIQASANERGTK